MESENSPNQPYLDNVVSQELVDTVLESGHHVHIWELNLQINWRSQHHPWTSNLQPDQTLIQRNCRHFIDHSQDPRTVWLINLLISEVLYHQGFLCLATFSSFSPKINSLWSFMLTILKQIRCFRHFVPFFGHFLPTSGWTIRYENADLFPNLDTFGRLSWWNQAKYMSARCKMRHAIWTEVEFNKTNRTLHQVEKA